MENNEQKPNKIRRTINADESDITIAYDTLKWMKDRLESAEYTPTQDGTTLAQRVALAWGMSALKDLLKPTPTPPPPPAPPVTQEQATPTDDRPFPPPNYFITASRAKETRLGGAFLRAKTYASLHRFLVGATSLKPEQLGLRTLQKEEVINFDLMELHKIGYSGVRKIWGMGKVAINDLKRVIGNLPYGAGVTEAAIVPLDTPLPLDAVLPAHE